MNNVSLRTIKKVFYELFIELYVASLTLFLALLLLENFFPRFVSLFFPANVLLVVALSSALLSSLFYDRQKEGPARSAPRGRRKAVGYPLLLGLLVAVIVSARTISFGELTAIVLGLFCGVFMAGISLLISQEGQ